MTKRTADMISDLKIWSKDVLLKEERLLKMLKSNNCSDSIKLFTAVSLISAKLFSSGQMTIADFNESFASALLNSDSDSVEDMQFSKLGQVFPFDAVFVSNLDRTLAIDPQTGHKFLGFFAIKPFPLNFKAPQYCIGVDLDWLAQACYGDQATFSAVNEDISKNNVVLTVPVFTSAYDEFIQFGFDMLHDTWLAEVMFNYLRQRKLALAYMASIGFESAYDTEATDIKTINVGTQTGAFCDLLRYNSNCIYGVGDGSFTIAAVSPARFDVIDDADRLTIKWWLPEYQPVKAHSDEGLKIQLLASGVQLPERIV